MRQLEKYLIAAICVLAVSVALPGLLPLKASAQETRRASDVASPVVKNTPVPFSGMDESVNVDLAKKAGLSAGRPYINVEQWGDLWNFLLLLGGGICGFVIGRFWDQIWGKRRTA